MKTMFLKKTASVIMTGALLLSLTSCLDFGGGKKAVLEAAQTFGENVASANADAIIKGSSLDKKSKEATVLNELLTKDGKSDDDIEFYKAVEKTIEFEIDEESYTYKKGTASVDMVFTIADYESVLKTEYSRSLTMNLSSKQSTQRSKTSLLP